MSSFHGLECAYSFNDEGIIVVGVVLRCFRFRMKIPYNHCSSAIFSLQNLFFMRISSPAEIKIQILGDLFYQHLFLRMKSPIRTDYRISKKNGTPIFDLKDMLMIVESLEEEALANEHRGKS